MPYNISMQFLPIKTRIMVPPQDDVFALMRESLSEVKNGDVICISSKVVAIHEGRCVASTEVDKATLVAEDADIVIPTDYRPFPLTITRHTFLGAAGIDESNGNGYLIRLPIDCFVSAQSIHEFVTKTYGVRDIGIIITDSRSLPFRYGAMGVALGWWGIEPLEDHIGNPISLVGSLNTNGQTSSMALRQGRPW